MDDIIKKKQYLQICSLKLEESNHKYQDLANILNVSPYVVLTLQISKDDVEVWAIEAIASGIIDAKIDQLKEEIVIKSHAMNKEWNSIKEKIADWRNKFERMQSVLQHTQQLSNAAVQK